MNENIFAGRNSDLLSSPWHHSVRLIGSQFIHLSLPFGFQPRGSGSVKASLRVRPTLGTQKQAINRHYILLYPCPPRCYEKIEQQQYSFGRRLEEGKEKEQGRGVRRSQRPQAGAWVGGPKGREASLTSLSPDGLRPAGYKGRWGAPPASPAPAEPLNAVVSALLT